MKLTKFNRKVISFIFVGLLNTVIDFAFYNLIFSSFKTSPVLANIFSTSIAITASYFLNKKLVFSHPGKMDIKSATTFVVFTLFGLWVIQGFIITLVVHFINAHYHSGLIADTKITNNIAKLIASSVTMVWNFTLYDLVVFKSKNSNSR
jgi:putative flippase GtrA